jgi:hypothetical protein
MSINGGDLQKSWVVFDHVKRVGDWTTLAADVYDPHYCGIMIIATCDMKVEDVNTQALFWRLLNLTCLEHGVPKVDFHGFMANDAHISNFKVLGKQSFFICFPPVSCFMQISFHFFSKFCMINMNTFIA